MKYSAYVVKRKLENIIIAPFIVLGKLIAILKPLKKEYETFYFFPFYHIGGAEKVHYQIASSTGDEKCIIFFTKKSLNSLYYDHFKSSGCRLIDISKFTDNKLLYFNNLVFRGIISHYINKQKAKPLVFNGQCNFGYKLSPWLNRSIAQIELIHSLCSFSYIRIPFIEYYYRTVMISTKRIKDHEALYDEYRIPAHYKSRIVFILNGISLPATTPNSIDARSLKILYVGRDTEEKRVDLIASVAREVIAVKKIDAQFLFMGDVQNAIPAELHEYCTFLGNQNEEELIDKIYRQANILLMLSTTEGFPMAIMEAMARGLSIVSTPVGEIPCHVTDNVNGFLLKEIDNNQVVFNQAVEAIAYLSDNKSLLLKFFAANITHANKYFSLDRFAREYNQLFNDARQQSGK